MSHHITPDDFEINPCNRIGLARHPSLEGRSDNPDESGVRGLHCNGGPGVKGTSFEGTGVIGEGEQNGVFGRSSGTGNGVLGQSDGAGHGVFGVSKTGEGVHGETHSTRFAAVAGISLNDMERPEGGFSSGVWGSSKAGEGVHGETNSKFFAAVAGIQLNPASTGAGIYGEHRGEGPAGFFKGNVVVTKDIFLTNADCAEDFDISQAATVEPGTVMVINHEGSLQESHKAYDKRVAGVVSGAGACRPAIVLDKRESKNKRMPIALLGKVYCKVDAGYSPIEVGDLLTTSPTPGHAMKADDPARAFGSVLGKALQPLTVGVGLIPVLVALQ